MIHVIGLLYSANCEDIAYHKLTNIARVSSSSLMHEGSLFSKNLRESLPSGLKNVLFSVADTGYLPRLNALFQSANSNAKIDLYKIAILVDVQENVSLCSLDQFFHIAYPIDVKGNSSAMRAFNANFRVAVLGIILESIIPQGVVMYADASSIFRGSLFYLFEYARSYDIVLYDVESFFRKACVKRKCFKNDVKGRTMKEKFVIPSGGSGFPTKKKNKVIWPSLVWRHTTRYKSSIFLVKASPEGKDFARRYLKNVQDSGLLKWYSDQIGLYKTVDQLEPAKKIGYLPQSYLDWQFNMRSNIWKGKGERKNSCKFCAQEFLYLKECGAMADKSCFHNCSLGRRLKVKHR